MCGRYTLATTDDDWARQFDVLEVLSLKPRYNIAPTQDVPVVRVIKQGSARELHVVRWGLIPFWASAPGIGSRMINARAETVDTKPAFREAFRTRRCLVPCSGFYEWKPIEGSKKKQPYYICGKMGSFLLWLACGTAGETQTGQKSSPAPFSQPKRTILSAHSMTGCP